MSACVTVNPLAAQVAVALGSGNQPEAVARFAEIADFCRAHETGRVLANYRDGALELLIAYHEAKGTLTVIRNRAQEIVGVHLWYRCTSEIDWDWVLQWQPDEPKGDAIFMAFLFCTEPGALTEITLDLIRREPDVLVKRLITSRFKAGGQQRIDRDVRYLHKILTLNERLRHGRR